MFYLLCCCCWEGTFPWQLTLMKPDFFSLKSNLIVKLNNFNDYVLNNKIQYWNSLEPHPYYHKKVKEMSILSPNIFGLISSSLWKKTYCNSFTFLYWFLNLEQEQGQKSVFFPTIYFLIWNVAGRPLLVNVTYLRQNCLNTSNTNYHDNLHNIVGTGILGFFQSLSKIIICWPTKYWKRIREIKHNFRELMISGPMLSAWLTPPIIPLLKIHVFNITNPDQVLIKL